MTVNMLIATVAWCLLVFGFLRRKTRRVHVRCMMSAILLDIGIVLYLQLTRDAVQTASKFELGLFPMLHIGSSLIAVLLYIPTVFLGLRLLSQSTASLEGLKAWHMRFAIPALTFRTLGFIFMFSMIK